MNYSFLTQDQQDDIVAAAMLAREMEHFHFAHNIVVYTKMLESLPIDSWPTELIQYQTMKRDEVVSSAGADAPTVLNYQYRDQLQHLVKTETAEAGRVDLIYNGLIAHFNGDAVRLADAIARVQAQA